MEKAEDTRIFGNNLIIGPDAIPNGNFSRANSFESYLVQSRTLGPLYLLYFLTDRNELKLNNWRTTWANRINSRQYEKFIRKKVHHRDVRKGNRRNRLRNHGGGYFNDDLNVNPPKKTQKDVSN